MPERAGSRRFAGTASSGVSVAIGVSNKKPHRVRSMFGCTRLAPQLRPPRRLGDRNACRPIALSSVLVMAFFGRNTMTLETLIGTLSRDGKLAALDLI